MLFAVLVRMKYDMTVTYLLNTLNAKDYFAGSTLTNHVLVIKEQRTELQIGFLWTRKQSSGLAQGQGHSKQLFTFQQYF